MELALLLLMFVQQDRAETLYERTLFPDEEEIQTWSAKSKSHARALKRVLPKKHWVGAFRDIEKRLGKFDDELKFHVQFAEWDSDRPAMGYRKDGNGFIRFNLRRLAEYQKKVDDYEAQQAELKKQGKRMVWKVPPLKFERLIHHELTHVLQNQYDAPEWFGEGMASWIGDDPNYLWDFGNAGKEVRAIDKPIAAHKDNYGRGWLFFEWLESKVLRKGIKELGQATLIERKPWKESIEKVTGITWEKIVEAEKKWSVKRIRRFTPK